MFQRRKRKARGPVINVRIGSVEGARYSPAVLAVFRQIAREKRAAEHRSPAIEDPGTGGTK